MFNVKKYENSYDKVLYRPLGGNWEIQVRNTGGDFALELTDGYTCRRVAYAVTFDGIRAHFKTMLKEYNRLTSTGKGE